MFVELFGDIDRVLRFFGRTESRAGHRVAIVLHDDVVAIFNALLRRMRQLLGDRRGVKFTFLVDSPEANDKISLLDLRSIYFLGRFVRVTVTGPHGCTVEINRF